MTLQNIMGHVRRACDDYKMIVPGCKILVGVSGGKDSLTLLAALAAMRRFYEPSYSLAAATVDLGFKEFDASGVAAYCKNLNVPFELIKTDIADVVFNVRKEKNPCALCSKMRKGALNDHAKKIFAGRVAYGHNRDDVLQTFFLSLFYEGRIHTCAPVTYLSRTDLHVVRPLMYVPEADIINFSRRERLPVIKSPCPADGGTKREEIKLQMKEFRKKYNYFDEKAFGAIKRTLFVKNNDREE